MTDLQPARGTHDLIGEDQRRHQHVADTARRVAATYGFDEWTTPIFEDTRVFSRTLGETSDVVMKEMYSFEDRGGEPITLRPEGTAGVCRALVTNGLTQSLPQKVFYAGPIRKREPSIVGTEPRRSLDFAGDDLGPHGISCHGKRNRQRRKIGSTCHLRFKSQPRSEHR